MAKRKWSKEKVIFEIKKRAQNGLSLRTTEVIKDNKSLYYFSGKYFKGWRNALAEAGFEYPGYGHRKWDRKKITKAIKERKKKGLSLNVSILQKEAPYLYIAARKYFGSWEKATCCINSPLSLHNDP